MGRKNPELWERAKRQAVSKMGGRHSARAMQLAGSIYRKLGGKYTGSLTKAQKSTKKWSIQQQQSNMRISITGLCF